MTAPMKKFMVDAGEYSKLELQQVVFACVGRVNDDVVELQGVEYPRGTLMLVRNVLHGIDGGKFTGQLEFGMFESPQAAGTVAECNMGELIDGIHPQAE